MNLPDFLRDNFGCGEETTRTVVQWVSTLDERGKAIFYHRLAGRSLRVIAEHVGVSHSTVSATIRTWGDLRERLLWLSGG